MREDEQLLMYSLELPGSRQRCTRQTGAMLYWISTFWDLASRVISDEWVSRQPGEWAISNGGWE
jgi:hypothetical protein